MRRQVKLPRTSQTHELCYEPKSRWCRRPAPRPPDHCHPSVRARCRAAPALARACARRSVFVSQMSNSILIRIPVGPDGLLADDQDAYM